ncbi:MarR family winged helix-turn-helix transcriptional regulator [Streptomyces niveus]|uniref:MarR family winged helix-turn-helix transcriptional regulator n=1 Tax=Streptomyces niveus TaxID=193462 RepID=UPI0037163D1A
MTDETTLGDDTPWLSATELESWVPLSGMLLGLVSALDAQLQSDAKVSFFGYLVLAGLSEAPGRTLPMSDLSILAHGSLSRLSHAVSTLEKRGWVRRSPSPENGRVTVATLTDAGYDKLVATAPGHVETVRRLVLDPIDADQLRALGQISTVIRDSMGSPRAWPPRPAAG